MIGILDSGIGGLSVYAEIVRLMPDHKIYYFADTAHCPYGDRSDEEIVALSRVCVKELVDAGCEVVVIACNTITSIAGQVLREEFPEIDIVGMEPAIKPAAEISKTKVVGVLATRATLAAEKYHNTRDRFAKGVKVIEMVGEGLVEMVEGDKVGTKECQKLVGGYIERLESEGADCVVLGCTHYPFLRGVIEGVSKKGISIIDPAEAVARRVKMVVEERVKRGANYDKGDGEEIFYSTKSGEGERIKVIANRLRNR